MIKVKKEFSEEENNLRYLLIFFILGWLLSLGILVFSIIMIIVFETHVQRHTILVCLSGLLFLSLVGLWIWIKLPVRKKMKKILKCKKRDQN
jgi:uncharacterized membrane protein